MKISTVPGSSDDVVFKATSQQNVRSVDLQVARAARTEAVWVSWATQRAYGGAGEVRMYFSTK